MRAAPCAPEGLLLFHGLCSVCCVQALQGAQLQVPGLSCEEWEVMQQGQAPTLGVAVLASKQAEVVVPLATAVAALTAEALQAKVGYSCNRWAAAAMADCFSCCPPVLHACTCARQACMLSPVRLPAPDQPASYIYPHTHNPLAAHAGQASAGV